MDKKIIYKNFIVGDMFEKISASKINGKASDFPENKEGEYTIPLLTAGINNNGLSKYAKPEQCGTILYNVISISANGTNSGATFYQSEKFAVLQDAYAIKLINGHVLNTNLGLYFATVINKILTSRYNWNNKANWTKVKSESISLPIKTDEDDNPIIDDTCEYHKDGFIPDFDFMESYMSGIMKKSIDIREKKYAEDISKRKEVVKEYACEGNTFHLTEKEQKALDGKKNKVEKDFIIGDMFISQNGDKDIKQEHINGKGIQVITSGVNNNGVLGRTDMPAKVIDKNTITIDMFGNAFYRDFEYKMVTHARVFSLEPVNKELTTNIGLYITTQLSKLHLSYSYSNMCSYNKIKNTTISLPIKTDEDDNPIIDDTCEYHKDGFIPDFDFMESYMSGIMKKSIDIREKKYAEDISKRREVVKEL